MPLINGTQKASFHFSQILNDSQYNSSPHQDYRWSLSLRSCENFLLPHLQMLVITSCFIIDPYYIDICPQFFAPANNKKESNVSGTLMEGFEVEALSQILLFQPRLSST